GNGKDDDGNGYIDDCAGWDVGDDDNDPDPRDLPATRPNGSSCFAGHGTFIAGLMAAAGDNGKGVTGVLQNARILPVKIPSNDECVILDTGVAEGVLYSLDQGARVINASWSFSGTSTTMDQAFAKIVREDAVLTIAAGNNSRDVDPLTSYPIDYHLRTDIVVAATTNKDERASFSNWGSDDVDLAAPGEQLFGLSLAGADKYEVGSGTSYAAPVVGGVAALILARYPELRATEVRQSILEGAEHLNALDCGRTAKCVQTGARLYAPGALEVAARWATSPQIKLDGITFNDIEWDGDRRVERGETVQVVLRVHNDGHAQTDSLWATLFVENEHVDVEVAAVKLGRVNPYQKVEAPPATISVDLACDQDKLTTYRVLFEDKITGDVWEDERAFTVYCDLDDDEDGHRYPEDCDDDDDAVYPGATELCNDLDDDCDEVVDEDDALDAPTWYPDADDDGFGAEGDGKSGCDKPEGYGAGDQDCDDSRTDVYPDADELCDERDNDCDGEVDEDPIEASIWYPDVDGDGWGDPEGGFLACEKPTGAVAEGRDCDDEDVLAFPGSRTRRADCTQRPLFLGCACSGAGSGTGWLAIIGALLFSRRRRDHATYATVASQARCPPEATRSRAKPAGSSTRPKATCTYRKGLRRSTLVRMIAP
ncbi:MAG: MYXO-CTERM domain-containing protein, partial [Kiritimatiellia bacterium]